MYLRDLLIGPASIRSLMAKNNNKFVITWMSDLSNDSYFYHDTKEEALAHFNELADESWAYNVQLYELGKRIRKRRE